jgi:hypothetical protein
MMMPKIIACVPAPLVSSSWNAEPVQAIWKP